MDNTSRKQFVKDIIVMHTHIKLYTEEIKSIDESYYTNKGVKKLYDVFYKSCKDLLNLEIINDNILNAGFSCLWKLFEISLKEIEIHIKLLIFDLKS